MAFFHLLLVLRAAIEFLPGGCSPHGIVRKEKCLQHLGNTNYDAHFQDMKVGDKLMLTSPGTDYFKLEIGSDILLITEEFCSQSLKES